MFLSYEYQKYLGYDSTTNLYSHQYKIIDTDFEVVGRCDGRWGGGQGVVETGTAIIQEYSKRNLNVVANLIRAFQQFSKKYEHSMSKLIEYNRQYNPEFHKYEKEMEKYLMLI